MGAEQLQLYSMEEGRIKWNTEAELNQRMKSDANWHRAQLKAQHFDYFFIWLLEAEGIIRLRFFFWKSLSSSTNYVIGQFCIMRPPDSITILLQK